MEKSKNPNHQKFPMHLDGKGLYGKYFLAKVNGEPVNPNNEYFILKLKGKGDPKHIEACRKAILVYANEIKDHRPELSKDLIEKYS